MQLTTTIVDDMDLELAPFNFRADPVKRTAVGRGLLGHVHFMWPVGERMQRLSLYYGNLTIEQARRLVTALGKPGRYNRTIAFDHDGPLYFIPSNVSLRVVISRGVATVTVETIARRFGSLS
jgi:hypothetical protein